MKIRNDYTRNTRSKVHELSVRIKREEMSFGYSLSQKRATHRRKTVENVV